MTAGYGVLTDLSTPDVVFGQLLELPPYALAARVRRSKFADAADPLRQ